MTAAKGQLFIVAAPSGAGKTSLVNALVNTLERIKISISHTTRPRRPSEQDKVNYFFVEPPRFQQMVQQGDFLEDAEVFGCQYGTSRRWVLEQLQQGIDVILEIDWQGAAKVRQQLPQTKSIFILPPSLAELAKRLTARRQDDSVTINYRMKCAQQEIEHYPEFDYLVVNNDFDQAVSELAAIVTAARLQRAYQRQALTDLLDDLLSSS
jgi:guanylate kinase